MSTSSRIPTLDEVYSAVKENLTELEQLRIKTSAHNRKVVRKIVITVVIGGIACALAGAAGEGLFIIPAIPTIGLLICFGFKYDSANKKKVTDQFIQTILHGFSPELRYISDDHIAEEVVDNGGLIHFMSSDRFRGENYIEGKYKDNHIRLSEIEIIRPGDKDKNESDTTIFEGLYIVAEFNKDFKTKTMVQEDVLESWFGYFGQSVQDLFSFGKLVKLENPEFEKHFAVYADDQVEARYLLSLTMMEKLVELHKDESNDGVACVFIDGYMHMALRRDEGLPDFYLSKSLFNRDVVYQQYSQLARIFNIIENYWLQPKLWSKQD